jgi:protein-S-isoprenylcysteine O-methyltransferase Ste14
MSLHKTMIEHGHQLFRWRGFIPLLLIGPLILAMKESVYVEEMFGDTIEDIWVLFSFCISMLGLALRCLTVGFIPGSTSGRNTTEQRADVLNTTGIYSVVRNPLYLANFIILLGVMLSIKVWWFALIFVLVFFIYMERIILTEESFLSGKFGKVYDEWRSKTPVILPNLKLWQKPDMPFSWKTVLKREYPGLLAIGTAFLVTEMVTDLVFEGDSFTEWLAEDWIWPVFYVVILIISLTLRSLKKHTNLLRVEGR